jgi:DEAD/DEAH box helicase domain-containing protein
MNAPNASTSALVASTCHAVEVADLAVLGSVTLPARTARHAPPPSTLHPRLQALLQRCYPDGLYTHQCSALVAHLGGDNVCLATPTASGKSLPFMAAAAEAVLRNPRARVLVLYPARALIQDQAQKWAAFLAELNLSYTFIDGSVPCAERAGLVARHPIVLMTPDVAHAWLLARQGQREPRAFLAQLSLVVLDEAHVYEGVFGTNMAYFLRRLRVSAPRARFMASTATIAAPAAYLEQLTGAPFTVIDEQDDGSAAPPRTVLHLGGEGIDLMAKAKLIASLARADTRFLAFADSRRMVEQLVDVSRRTDLRGDEDVPEDALGEGLTLGPHVVLPYRSGYEPEDRTAIQQALAQGRLAGVVSTSAMELGIDIGEINLVVMLDVPPTVKSFRQRLGRAGRRSEAVCIVLDADGSLGTEPDALPRYLARPMEPSWLYLDNRYIQYANALCAAVEARAHGQGADASPYQSLPASFRVLLDNEIVPNASIADDLYPLKQRGMVEPHVEFPIRHGTERTFQVTDFAQAPLGSVTFKQVLREAYPGAVYRYLARPHRVRHFDHRNGRIVVTREKHVSTRPTLQSMVFPTFLSSLALRTSESGFIAEVPVQVSARVIGFTEQRGRTKTEHRYGPQSPWYHRELNHFFSTTGVCWYFPGKRCVSEDTATWVLRAFCEVVGVHEGDVGVGTFHAKSTPLGPGVRQGVCIFDASDGSLRLTQHLLARFDAVIARAIELAAQDDSLDAVDDLEALASLVCTTRSQAVGAGVDEAPVITHDDEWMECVMAGERAVLTATEGAREVTVVGFRYTPRGPMYELAPEQPGVRWMVPQKSVRPIYGVTRTERISLVTGEAA